MGGMNLDPKISKLDAAIQTQIYDEWVEACLDAERHYNKMILVAGAPHFLKCFQDFNTINRCNNLKCWGNNVHKSSSNIVVFIVI